MKTYLLLGLALLSVHVSLAQNNHNNAEVFIQIEERGNFTVYLNDEFVGSTTGKFRFYNVTNNGSILSILQGNKRVYSNKIDLRPNIRSVLSYSSRKGLQVRKELTIYRNGQYALNDFDDYIVADLDVVPPIQPNPNSYKQFETLEGLVKRAAFDDDKIKLIQAYTVQNSLSTAQAALLLKNFSHDDKKLFLAKSIASVIIDPQNFYTLRESFTFLTAKEDFLNYLNAQQVPRADQLMRNATFQQLFSAVKKETFDDDKTKLIQAAVQNAAPSTAQLAELLKLYTFEDKALHCAKMAYSFVIDKQRYFTIAELFKFNSTKDSLLAFLAQR